MNANFLANGTLRRFLASGLFPAVFRAVTAAFFVLVIFQLLVGPTSAARTQEQPAPPHTGAANSVAAVEPVCIDEPEPLEWPHKINMDAIFPPGAGRGLVLWNCLNCHPFVRIVIGNHFASDSGLTSDTYWDLHRIQHGARVTRLSDVELDVLYTYVKANFNDTKPEPTLPCWLLESYW